MSPSLWQKNKMSMEKRKWYGYMDREDGVRALSEPIRVRGTV
jgi:hypothetical protein